MAEPRATTQTVVTEDFEQPPSATRRALTPVALTALRIGVGIVMIAHGWGKLTALAGWREQVTGLQVPMPNLAALLAVAGELLGGIGLVFGLLTPLAAFGVLAVMATAIATVHWGHGLLADNGGFELPLVIGLVALFFMVRGAGPLSLDALFMRRIRNRRVRRVTTAREGVIVAPPPPSAAQPVAT